MAILGPGGRTEDSENREDDTTYSFLNPFHAGKIRCNNHNNDNDDNDDNNNMVKMTISFKICTLIIISRW